MAKISEVGRSKTQDTPPDHGINTEYDPLLEGQPVEYIKHVGRYVSSSRNAAYETRGSADNALEAAQTHSRETNNSRDCPRVSNLWLLIAVYGITLPVSHVRRSVAQWQCTGKSSNLLY